VCVCQTSKHLSMSSSPRESMCSVCECICVRACVRVRVCVCCVCVCVFVCDVKKVLCRSKFGFLLVVLYTSYVGQQRMSIFFVVKTASFIADLTMALNPNPIVYTHTHTHTHRTHTQLNSLPKTLPYTSLSLRGTSFRFRTQKPHTSSYTHTDKDNKTFTHTQQNGSRSEDHKGQWRFNQRSHTNMRTDTISDLVKMCNRISKPAHERVCVCVCVRVCACVCVCWWYCSLQAIYMCVETTCGTIRQV